MDVRVPRLAEGVESATVANILVSEGGRIARDQVILEEVHPGLPILVCVEVPEMPDLGYHGDVAAAAEIRPDGLTHSVRRRQNGTEDSRLLPPFRDRCDVLQKRRHWQRRSRHSRSTVDSPEHLLECEI